MSKSTPHAKKKKTAEAPKALRCPLNLELPDSLRLRLKKIAEDNDIPLSVAARMAMNTGVGLVENKLAELREPAVMPS